MSLQSQTIEYLSNKQFLNGTIQFSQIKTNQTKSIRIQSKIEPLARFTNSANTNVSRSISFSLFDLNGNEISLDNYPIEMFIPRDPNRIVPPMIIQNVTSINLTFHQQLFYLHYINITTILSISIHIEIEPLNSFVAYLFICKFDQIPQLNQSIYQIDHWKVFCPSNSHFYFLDNQQTQIYCSNNNSPTNPPITNDKFHFTSNYQLRIYSSGCYFLNKNNQLNDQTHCLT